MPGSSTFELLIHSPGGESHRVPLNKVRTTIGRSSRSEVCIPDAFASRLHAEVRLEGEAVWLADLGSANGTKVNGMAVSSPVPLKLGDEFRIGETVFEVASGAAPAPASALLTEGTEALDPSKTISFSIQQKTTDFLSSQFSSRGDLLGLISKVGVTLLSSSGLEDTLRQVAGLVFGAVPAERCVIMLRESGPGSEMKVAVARHRDKEDSLEEVRISRNVMSEVLAEGRAVLTADAQHDPRYASQTMALLGIRSVLAVPLSVDGKDVFGLVYADSPTEEATFTEEHLNILTTLASVAAIRVENARLLDERLEKERFERELALASEIQQRFLPAAAPAVEGYEMQGISFSCYEIGGDYYDFIDRGDGRMLVALGDVSGKGTAAALLMSSLHASVHAQVSAGRPLEEIPRSINEYLSENTPTNRFVTLFISELDVRSGRIRFVNAGHNSPIVCRASGELSELESGGLPLGLLPGSGYDAGEEILGIGDFLIVYSDGVTEAVDVAGEEFGTERLRDVVRRGIGGSAAALRDAIESALSSFTTTAPAADDITLVIVKRVG